MSKKTAQALAPKEWQARFKAAAAVVQREYCERFEFWRACRRKPCRRRKTCGGDAFACLKRNVDCVASERKDLASAEIIDATPAHADAPTQTARRLLADDFCAWP